uniref:Ig-like domain-containing protein n=1 Tax=Macrostomum lignano TaxID=282301 RepID=A0A1I8F6B9_9PLAT
PYDVIALRPEPDQLSSPTSPTSCQNAAGAAAAEDLPLLVRPVRSSSLGQLVACGKPADTTSFTWRAWLQQGDQFEFVDDSFLPTTRGDEVSFGFQTSKSSCVPCVLIEAKAIAGLIPDFIAIQVTHLNVVGRPLPRRVRFPAREEARGSLCLTTRSPSWRILPARRLRHDVQLAEGDLCRQHGRRWLSRRGLTRRFTMLSVSGADGPRPRSRRAAAVQPCGQNGATFEGYLTRPRVQWAVALSRIAADDPGGLQRGRSCARERFGDVSQATTNQRHIIRVERFAAHRPAAPSSRRADCIGSGGIIAPEIASHWVPASESAATGISSRGGNRRSVRLRPGRVAGLAVRRRASARTISTGGPGRRNHRRKASRRQRSTSFIIVIVAGLRPPCCCLCSSLPDLPLPQQERGLLPGGRGRRTFEDPALKPLRGAAHANGDVRTKMANEKAGHQRVVRVTGWPLPLDQRAPLKANPPTGKRRTSNETLAEKISIA